ncbi:MAG TPA: hypothetical protein VKS81_00685 [Bacteroidota bacterium]|nr:hypothetical protein [Bacteroidota bacterium]
MEKSIRNGLNLPNVNSYVQQVVVGVVIPIAVLLDQMKNRKR